MGENVVYKDDYLRIFIGSDGAYIESFKKGFPIEQLPIILQKQPDISVTSLITLRNAVIYAPKKPEKFGEFKGRIHIDLSPDEVTATITFKLQEEELLPERREALIKEVITALSKLGIVYGIKNELLSGTIENDKKYVIAEGNRPFNGNDAVIKMYELKENGPEITENGKVDLYELRLINRVKMGDWLGERIEATEGFPGKSVKGVEIKQLVGKTQPLNFDKNTVQEVPGTEKTLLFARINGAVNYDKGKISISDHLDIAGDIGVSTGNIKFDGYVTIRGTICDGFSLEATKDIEINGELGLGNIKSIISTDGSIYIKGGISSKGKSVIQAAKNVFTKFSDNTEIICGKSTHIGFYCLNSNIEAEEVIIDSTNGHIIGGSVKAKIRVASPYIGSQSEKRTYIEVTGFERQLLVNRLDTIFHTISGLKTEQQKLKQLIASTDTPANLNQNQKKDYLDNCEKLYNVKEKLKELEEERKITAEYLKAKGEGEINVSKKIYPNCTLVLQQRVMEIISEQLAVSFYLQDGQIKQT